MRLTCQSVSSDPARTIEGGMPSGGMRSQSLIGRLRHLVSRRRKSMNPFADTAGASAVEFALVSMPFLLLCLGILQFLFLHYTQQTLTNALYNSASSPETVLTQGNKTGYIAAVCAKVFFPTDCLNSTTGLKVELIPLASLSTTATAITGAAALNPGASGDALVLRASMQVPRIVSFIPLLTARDSVIFRRP